MALGDRPETVTVPSGPVTYRPMFRPSLSLTVNSAPFRGFWVTASRFRMVRVQRGSS